MSVGSFVLVFFLMKAFLYFNFEIPISILIHFINEATSEEYNKHNLIFDKPFGTYFKKKNLTLLMHKHIYFSILIPTAFIDLTQCWMNLKSRHN